MEANQSSTAADLCGYCGQQPGITRDHVIPKCIYVGVDPANVLIVPACQSCNLAKSESDQDLRDLLANDYRISFDSRIETIRWKSVRAAQTNRSKMITRRNLRKVRSKYLVTEKGIIYGNIATVPIDGERVKDAFRWLVRGIHHRLTGKWLPADLEIEVLTFDDHDFASFVEAFMDQRLSQRHVGDFFHCSLAYAEEDHEAGIYNFLFYKRVPFQITTKPQLLNESFEEEAILKSSTEDQPVPPSFDPKFS